MVVEREADSRVRIPNPPPFFPYRIFLTEKKNGLATAAANAARCFSRNPKRRKLTRLVYKEISRFPTKEWIHALCWLDGSLLLFRQRFGRQRIQVCIGWPNANVLQQQLKVWDQRIYYTTGYFTILLMQRTNDIRIRHTVKLLSFFSLVDRVTTT